MARSCSPRADVRSSSASTTHPALAGFAAWEDGVARREVILDDDNNAQEAYLNSPDGCQAVFYPRANGGFSVGTQGVDFFRGGDLVNGLTGVLHWSFPGFGNATWRIRPTAAHPMTFTVANPRPVTPPPVGGAIKAVGMNLLNYFTTIDTTASNTTGPCGPSGGQDCRGADSVAELNRQRERASIVVCTLNADVYAFMELENTTPSDTITDLLGAINARCGGAHPFAFVNTGGTLGTDAIRVQQIYRTGVVSPVGSPLVDLDPIHNRPPTAQTYDVVDAANPAFGKRFTVIANHFKSKGSCPGIRPGHGPVGRPELLERHAHAAGDAAVDLDQRDGDSGRGGPRRPPPRRFQLVRARGLRSPPWRRAATPTSRPRSTRTPTPTCSAPSWGTSTTASPTPACFRRSPAPPPGTSTPTRSTSSTTTTRSRTPARPPSRRSRTAPRWCRRASSSQPGTPYRASDHDPVLVGLFPVADLAITKTDGVTTATPGGSVTYTITASNAGPSSDASATVADTFPAALTCTWTCVGAGGGTCTASGSGNLNDTVNLPAGGSVTYTASCAITAAATGTLSNTATVTNGATSDSTRPTTARPTPTR